MKGTPIQIEFQNNQNPKTRFDLVKLDELLLRKEKELDHSPFKPHLVTFYMILVIEKGEGFHTIDFTKHHYKKGTLLTIRKDQIHKFHQNNTVKGTLLLFTDEFIVSYLEKLEGLKSLQLFNEFLGNPKVQLKTNEFIEVIALIERIKNEYFNLNDTYSSSIIRSELHILITKLHRIKSKNNQIINRKYLESFINFQNLVENNVSKNKKVNHYANIMGVSTKTLNTITKTNVNKSAKEFIDDICIKQIKRLLINTSYSVKEIAFISGFEETTNFYKYFKRQTKLTPEQFRGKF